MADYSTTELNVFEPFSCPDTFCEKAKLLAHAGALSFGTIHWAAPDMPSLRS
jgi:hypothetical protein